MKITFDSRGLFKVGRREKILYVVIVILIVLIAIYPLVKS